MGISVAKSSFSGEILHVGSVRLRVTGEGTLQLTLNSLDDTHTQDLADLEMVTATNKEPVQLANFRDQRIQVYGRVTGFEEWFSISRIIVYVKESATGYPQ